MNHNPYSAPQSDLETHSKGLENTPLWNPNAAALWSLLFTPIFGAILHMKNWEALGEPEKAAASKTWAIMTFVVLLGTSIVAALYPDGLFGRLSNFVGIGLLVGWYMGNGRAQVELIKEAGSYQKRGWGQPLLFGVLGYVALFAMVFALLAITGDFQ